MNLRPVKIGTGASSVLLGSKDLALICGPCVIESRSHALEHAQAIQEICQAVRFPLIFKSSFDKANRTSGSGYRGVGLAEGLAILAEIRETFNLPVVTDVHTAEQVFSAAAVVDLLQIPAFLCRQTDLLTCAGQSQMPVMIKKGQFLAPTDMGFAAEKATTPGAAGVILCERGSCFGYRELIVDYRGLMLMREMGYPVVFDATHSVQVMGGGNGKSRGDRRFAPALARAAVSVGVDGIFLESHFNPETAPSDGPNMLPISSLKPLLEDLKSLAQLNLQTRSLD